MELSSNGNYADRGISEVFSALADPVRHRILERLLQGEAAVTELAADLNVRTPSMSKHLTVLERAGFLKRRAEAQRRLCSLEPQAFLALRNWTDHYETVWTGRLARLQEVLNESGER
ncbi:MAG TPA: metalloregulator ArsR/SmtB family transcription factor [Trueperaceae bacterium]|nr:metalloregulator ArsR/SmtB family transcription factor [Trueperaceae bacterium]